MNKNLLVVYGVIMEEFNIFGNDFLSNGEFHHLYTTFDHQDEICLWDNRIDFDLQPKWNYSSDSSIGNSTGVDYNSYQVDFIDYADNIGHEIEPMASNNNGHGSTNLYNYGEQAKKNSETTTDTFITDMDEWKQSHLDDLMYQSNNSNEWDLNLDSLIMDTPCDDSVFNVCDLPARTFYCNDSCTDFLKETSEHLDTSLRTFQPSSIHQSQYGSANFTKVLESDVPANYGDRKKFPNFNGDEKEFICTYGDCRKVYAKAGHLKAHIRRHIGDKPYVCQWPNCTWKFSRSDELSRHRRSHSGIKPYHCDLCPKCFSRSDHLTKHRKVHERKMAAMKIKTIWTKLPPRKPGRKPKSQTNNQ